MSRKCAMALSAALAIMSFGPASAGDGNGVIYGVGAKASCGSWTEDRRKDNWYDKGQWMLGFISAVSVFDVLDIKRRDTAAFAAFVDKYCSEHPLDYFSDAVRALVQELKTTA